MASSIMTIEEAVQLKMLRREQFYATSTRSPKSVDLAPAESTNLATIASNSALLTTTLQVLALILMVVILIFILKCLHMLCRNKSTAIDHLKGDQAFKMTPRNKTEVTESQLKNFDSISVVM